MYNNPLTGKRRYLYAHYGVKLPHAKCRQVGGGLMRRLFLKGVPLRETATCFFCRQKDSFYRVVRRLGCNNRGRVKRTVKHCVTTRLLSSNFFRKMSIVIPMPLRGGGRGLHNCGRDR